MISSQYIRQISLRRDAIDDFNRYPFSLPAVRHLDTIKLHPKVTYFVGENGSGKSTLLEAIAVSMGFNPEGGTRNFNFSTRSSHSLLSDYLRVAKGLRSRDGFFLRAESFFNLATNIEDLDNAGGLGPPIISHYGNRSLHEQSHGESFMALMMHRFSGDSLFLLDEPEAALSPQRQLAAMARMHQLIKQNSQFIIATHSPILMAYPDALIYQFGSDGVTLVDYESTEHFKITRDFLSNPKRMLDVLFEDE